MDGAPFRADASLRACFGLHDGRLDAGRRGSVATSACPAAAQACGGHGWPRRR